VISPDIVAPGDQESWGRDGFDPFDTLEIAGAGSGDAVVDDDRVALLRNGVLLGDASNAFAGLADAIAATARQDAWGRLDPSSSTWPSSWCFTAA
jgi:hypothetical protein